MSTPSRPPAARTLKKASSLADLAKRHLSLKRFKPKPEFDFGCQGVGEHDSDDDDTTTPPVRPRAPFQVVDEAHFTPHQLRALKRQEDEALAASACLEYIHSNKPSHPRRAQHSRTHSRSSSATSHLHLHLPLHDRDATLTAVDCLSSSSSTSRGPNSHPRPHHHPHPHHARSDSASTASSLCSSRPRTNDSLPSFASSDAATYSSAGSYPPSPVTTHAAGSTEKRDSDDDPAHQPRAYAFI
ncbi:hypothetical protein JCM11491_002693 [Sporobolomyces phaffii]